MSYHPAAQPQNLIPNPAHPAFGGVVNAWPAPQPAAAHATVASPVEPGAQQPHSQPQQAWAAQAGHQPHGHQLQAQWAPQVHQPQGQWAPQHGHQPHQQWAPQASVVAKAPNVVATWARIVAYVLSGLKAAGLGLVFLVFLPFLLSDFATAEATFLGWETTSKPQVFLVLLGMVAFGGSFLVAQVRGAAKGKPVMLMIAAGIMTTGDATLAIASALDSPNSLIFFAPIAVAQAAILFGAVMARFKKQ